VSRAGRPRDGGERERKKMTAASVESRKTSSSRPGLRRSAVACTVEGGLDSREGREKHTEEEGKQFADLQRGQRACIYTFSGDKYSTAEQ
jgi:hypothetical protein